MYDCLHLLGKKKKTTPTLLQYGYTVLEKLTIGTIIVLTIIIIIVIWLLVMGYTA